MKQFLLTAMLLLVPLFATAQTDNKIIVESVEGHILPRIDALADNTAQLEIAARDDCMPNSAPLRSAYGRAFDAWVSASHLRFGPSEVDDRAFALAFWPDSRGVTPRALAQLIADQDPIAATPEAYAQMSIAARGFYALEFLLYDADLIREGDADYHCTLVQTVAGDIARTSSAIATDWHTNYAAQMLAPQEKAKYRRADEVLRELFKALTTGLQFTSETRLGRPLGTYDRPRPMRAENWRSGRSARHVSLSLASLQDLAARLANSDPDLAMRLAEVFAQAQARLDALDDPVFARITDPQRRLKLEVVQQSVDSIREVVRNELGPSLGVAAGFNSLDGD
ncbi:imelysin family protein [Sulfitobacter sp. F26204]|uniref:imelysin family protein n=1 Tax=Sulfitobacter sp. F26204 TaxID=2996014 RepID=UPI00225E40FE|nr:imelysin family protein [Sulfitobacter sp. F26204]MCX7559251.1 imelysin family protein [Sulfitobacter sp. F26204]